MQLSSVRSVGVAAVMAMIVCPRARADEPAFSTSVSAGLLVPDQGEAVSSATWFVQPALSYWFDGIVGLEVAVGLSTLKAQPSRDPVRWIFPSLSLVIDALPPKLRAPVRPILRVGGGVRDTRVGSAKQVLEHRIDGTFITQLGIAIPVLGALRVHLDAGFMLTAGQRGKGWLSPSENFLLTAGLDIKLGVGRDQDHDDVVDRLDPCIDEPEDFDGFQDDDGCPEDDDDQDGVRDTLDGCRSEAEDIDGFEDYDGCIDADNDRDGVPDVDDNCPNEAGDLADAGCPYVPPPAEPTAPPASVAPVDATMPSASVEPTPTPK